ncbi:Arc family DNA-binding protein [Paracoccus sediminilitoris]|uniref:Arc family DNA-binding protein n=1 Tax=Paracoccus sediminilitoris TaxID=2202419 RepID=UPI00272B3229|nr:Arc family DNA-binding protein [Paracoccus sediminilitoris]
MSTDDSRTLTRDIAPFGVRMPRELKDRVEAAAKASGRSMNSEIVTRIQQTFDGLVANVPRNLPPGLLERMTVASSFNNRSLQDEIIQTLLEKYPPPQTGEYEDLLNALKIVLGSMSDRTGNEEAASHLKNVIQMFENANPDLAGPIAREFLQHIIDRHDGTSLSGFANRAKTDQSNDRDQNKLSDDHDS